MGRRIAHHDRLFSYSKIGKMKRLLFTILYFLIFIPLVAQQLSEQEIIQKMASAAKEIKTVQADFKQTKYMKMLAKEMVSEGKMYCQQPDKLRWEYTSPRANVIILNGTEGSGTKNKFVREMARLIMKLVAGQGLTDSSTFQVTAEELPTEYVATLLPLKKEMKQFYTKLVLHFDNKQSTVTEVELYEKNGDRTVIELHDIRINKN